ncbi:MAG: hypothetical protein ACD_2C00010G0006 [uncultured bacterium (gcode 4)]|uniref:3-oxoacyl-[acyl-carrier-protein] reductase n=1 Tax=uncultured bacterium (gcode 4) TaxID=1234023 RepID=K2G4X3_9BACT|nr:MAG: hypothetical protein ACD_2C00010G0006 [uncultured bacterium (gcode 4)]
MQKNERFKDKVVFITGSAKWIGRAIWLQFAKDWAKVVINYLYSWNEALKTVSDIKEYSDWIAIQGDVSDEKQVKKMIKETIKKFWRLDILVNNAWWYIDWDEWNGTSDIWERTLRHNLISVMNTSKYATEIFIKQKSWVIVNIASRHALSWHFYELAYSASKAWIVSVTQSYSKLLMPFWRANSICPWPTNSGYWFYAPKEELEATIEASPYKRLLEPDEIASTVLYLASDEASMITWQNLLIGWGR